MGYPQERAHITNYNINCEVYQNTDLAIYDHVSMHCTLQLEELKYNIENHDKQCMQTWTVLSKTLKSDIYKVDFNFISQKSYPSFVLRNLCTGSNASIR